MKKHKVIILVGPGGVGKSTISQYLCSHYPDSFQETVSCTTRQIRKGEKNGVHYYFLSEKEFAEKIKNDEFLCIIEPSSSPRPFNREIKLSSSISRKIVKTS